jgi:hypothetical protein
VSKFLATLISIAIVATGFTSTAQAFPGRRLGFFLGGMAAGAMIGHAAEERRRDAAYERMRAREMMIAQQRAGAAAAARRARALALKQQQAAAAAQAAAAQAQAGTANTTTAASTTDNANTTVLAKGNLLPVSEKNAPTQTTATAEATTVSDTSSEAAETCRKYSPAADGLIDVPCK